MVGEGWPEGSSAGARGRTARAEEAEGTLEPLTELFGWGWTGQVLKYLGGDGEGEASSTAAVHRHVCLLHAVTLFAYLQAKEVQVGQGMRPSPSASGKVNVSRLRHPQEWAEQGIPVLTRSCSTKAISFFCRASTSAISMASVLYCIWQLGQSQPGSTNLSWGQRERGEHCKSHALGWWNLFLESTEYKPKPMHAQIHHMQIEKMNRKFALGEDDHGQQAELQNKGEIKR